MVTPSGDRSEERCALLGFPTPSLLSSYDNLRALKLKELQRLASKLLILGCCSQDELARRIVLELALDPSERERLRLERMRQAKVSVRFDPLDKNHRSPPPLSV